MAECALVSRGSSVGSFLVVEEKSVTNSSGVFQQLNFDVCTLQSRFDVNSLCGRNFKHNTKNGTNSMLRHLQIENSNHSAVKESFRLCNISVNKELIKTMSLKGISVILYYILFYYFILPTGI